MFDIDKDYLKRFEEGLDTLHPENSVIKAQIIGYGEISAVFCIEGYDKLAFKRIPMFESEEQSERYIETYKEYNRLLNRSVKLPENDILKIKTDDGRIVVYVVQNKLESESIANNAIGLLPEDTVRDLIVAIFSKLKNIFSGNTNDLMIGIDGQLSNWGIYNFKEIKSRESETVELCYLDTTTPLIRKNGVEQIETKIFLKSVPSLIGWFLKLFFLKEVLDRYYNFRSVIVDFIANFFKEGRPDLIPTSINIANEFLADLSLNPIELKEIESYYKRDAFIWRAFLLFRKFDRFVKKNLKKRYDFILPGKIKR